MNIDDHYAQEGAGPTFVVAVVMFYGGPDGLFKLREILGGAGEILDNEAFGSVVERGEGCMESRALAGERELDGLLLLTPSLCDVVASQEC